MRSRTVFGVGEGVFVLGPWIVPVVNMSPARATALAAELAIIHRAPEMMRGIPDSFRSGGVRVHESKDWQRCEPMPVGECGEGLEPSTSGYVGPCSDL